MKEAFIKEKELVLVFSEGEAEKLIFNFLKINYSNKKRTFKGPKDLGGIRDLAEFKRKYDKLIRGLDFKPRQEFLNVKLLFLLDNDLDDSEKIANFIIKKGHLFQFYQPNIEAMILTIVGYKQVKTVSSFDYRKKCKKEFFHHFGCEAHQLKDKQLREIFTLIALKKHLVVLARLFIT